MKPTHDQQGNKGYQGEEEQHDSWINTRMLGVVVVGGRTDVTKLSHVMRDAERVLWSDTAIALQQSFVVKKMLR